MSETPEEVERHRLESTLGDFYPDGRPKMHRHSMTSDVHRDDECSIGVLPDGKWATSRRRVYVFDDDVLPEHERIVSARAWDEGFTRADNGGDESENPYREATS